MTTDHNPTDYSQAECNGMDPRLFDERGETEAHEACGRCRMRAECLRDAMRVHPKSQMRAGHHFDQYGERTQIPPPKPKRAYQEQKPSIEEIPHAEVMAAIAAVSTVTGIEPYHIDSHSRVRAVIDARHAVWWILRRRHGFVTIGRSFGYDHTSIMNGVARVNKGLTGSTHTSAYRLLLFGTRGAA